MVPHEGIPGGSPSGNGRSERRAPRSGPARRIVADPPQALVAASVLALSAAAWLFSFFIRFEFRIPGEWRPSFLLALPWVVLVEGLVFKLTGVFRILWPYVGIGDALMIGRSALVSTAVLLGLNALDPGSRSLAPHSVIILNGVAMPVAVCALFMLLRFRREARSRSRPESGRVRRVLIVGAGDSGDALLREIERLPDRAVEAAGFIDDDPGKVGAHLRGVEVLGGTLDVVRLAKVHDVRHILVALPGTSQVRLREIVTPLLAAGLNAKVLSSRERFPVGAPLLPRLRDVAIEDLLRRDPIQLDEEEISDFLGGKCVLVTGAAGSIGSELCRQILRYGPSKVVAVDWAETPLHALMLELGAVGGTRLVAELGDVTDFVRIRAIFASHSPEIVFHAAALKHVPVCEDHPREAIRVNVGGTQTVARVALCSDTRAFVLISTDKAVKPSSVMGSTKRAAELILQGLQREGGPTRFAAVRFGNVLGSNGSVLEIFRRQIARGGPLTVTHPNMRRYFMTVSEAVQLVLQAARLGAGGEIFELDMGEPVRIVDLARDFIRLSGLTPGRDIALEFTGVRPGEKLSEELYLNSETIEPTSHPQVFCLKQSEAAGDDPSVKLCLDRLGPVDPATDPDLARLNRAFRRLLEEVPSVAKEAS